MTAGWHRDRVHLPGRETDIVIGPGPRSGLWAALAERYPRAWQFGLVIDRHVEGLWPPVLPGTGPGAVVVRTPPGELAKTRRVLARIQDRLLDLRRGEPVIAIGGGALLDVAGFAAATVRRGLPWIAVPTTVVGMADASVGGKVAVNHGRGKNLLGTFHPPVLVISDVEYLETLSPRDCVAGLAEIYKVARIGDPDLLGALRRGAPSDAGTWVEVIARSIAVKARVVEADERDQGPRRALNYGHTVGHALERMLGADAIRHGEGVAMGMGVAARIARGRRLVDDAVCERQADDLERLGLPTDLPGGIGADALLETMGLDKKRSPGAHHTFVLPTGDVGMEIAEDVAEDEVREALRR